MWTCMTLYNRPQVCFTPELQPEWLLALICIFVGCICITTAIILLASSNWDRDVIPYARWVGFTASKIRRWHSFEATKTWYFRWIDSNFHIKLIISHCLSLNSGAILFGSCDIPTRISHWWDWRATISATELTSSWILLHYVCACTLDYCDIGTICRKSLSTALLIDCSINVRQPPRNNCIDLFNTFRSWGNYRLNGIRLSNAIMSAFIDLSM